MAFLDDIDPDNFYFGDSDCSYYDTQSFNSDFVTKSSSLQIIHLNIRSAKKNFDEFQLLLASLKTFFHIIVLSETWLGDPSHWVPLNGYKAYHSVRYSRKGGGVTILVDDNIKSTLLPQFSLVCDDAEICSVRLSIESRNYNIIGVYRPPDRPVGNFTDIFFRTLTDVEISKNPTVILGDFNIDMCATNPPDSTNAYIDEFRALHFVPYITVPTRVTNDTASLIDHLWFNMLFPCRSGVLSVQISDHFPIFVSVSNVLKKDKQLITSKFRCHGNKNISDFRIGVTNLLFDIDMSDTLSIDDKWRVFIEKLFDAYNASCPIAVKTISVKRSLSPWITSTLLKCIARKHELYRLSKIDNSFTDEYKNYRNMLSSVIYYAKKHYYSKKFNSCINDVKKTWKSINELLCQKVKCNNVTKVSDGGTVIEDVDAIADLFNEHYVSIADRLAQVIPAVNQDPVKFVKRNDQTFVYFPTDQQEVMHVINSFKSKNSNLDSIPSFMYKHVADIISPIIAELINSSINLGTFPDVLKISRVIPIYKSGVRDKVINYRPISILDFLEKVFERIISKRITNFLNKFSIICDQQFGFRKGRSTSDALLQYAEAIYSAFDNVQYSVSVMLDLSKAFDTVDHAILLKKLELLGVRGVVLQWFTSYLSNRKQYVNVNCCNSSRLPVTSGVPQGSILGPLLFSLYINDMHACSSKLNFIHFADDTTLFMRGPNLSDLCSEINEELKLIDLWLCSNRLSLNIDKTASMVHTNKDKSSLIPLQIRGKPINLVNTTKFLGVYVDDKFNFKDHINQVCNKLSRSCGILSRLSEIIPIHALRKIYLSLVYPYLVYCVEVWGGASEAALSRLCSLQNRIVKLFDCGIGADINTVYVAQELMPLACIYRYFTSVKFFKYFKLNQSVFFRDLILENQIYHNQNTRFRANNCLNIPPVRKTKCFNSFKCSAIRIWNGLPITMRDCNTVSSFKTALRQWLLLTMNR
jgi:endonuclease/exonuclease/phosphatase family metal-dependent hydrolase